MKFMTGNLKQSRLREEMKGGQRFKILWRFDEVHFYVKSADISRLIANEKKWIHILGQNKLEVLLLWYGNKEIQTE